MDVHDCIHAHLHDTCSYAYAYGVLLYGQGFPGDFSCTDADVYGCSRTFAPCVYMQLARDVRGVMSVT
jgi:hypothetical protein